MKKILVAIMLFVCIALNAKEYLTLYNNSFALYKTKLEMNLKKGMQSYSLYDIPNTIDLTTINLTPESNNLRVIAQNYNLKNFQDEGSFSLINILKDCINTPVKVVHDRDQICSGILINYNEGNIVIQDTLTMQNSIIKRVDVKAFFSDSINKINKKSVQFSLETLEKGYYKADLTYLINNIYYTVFYDAVYENEKLLITP